MSLDLLSNEHLDIKEFYESLPIFLVPGFEFG